MTAGQRAARWTQRLCGADVEGTPATVARCAVVIIPDLFIFSVSAGQRVGITMQLTNAELLVHDEDQSPSSRELIHRFQPPILLWWARSTTRAKGFSNWIRARRWWCWMFLRDSTKPS